MSVNPNLDTLMRVIEDQQNKMPEGEYLAAMNALGALHRVVPAPPAPPAPIPSGHPPGAGAAGAALFNGGAVDDPEYNSYSSRIALMGQYGYNTWCRVTRMMPEFREMTPLQWVTLSQDQQNCLNRHATFKIVQSYEVEYRNPDPKTCPFIARHAVGPWTFGGERCQWTCACGYSGKSKNWKKHEESERHTDWAQSRFVPKRTIDAMKMGIKKDEAGEIMHFNQPLSGGIRYFQVTQERNEWTHPELYDAGVHRSRNGNGEWFVHHRDDCAHQYVI